MILLLLLIGVVVYAVLGRSGRTARVDGSDVKEAWASVKGASQNAVTTSKVKSALALSKNVSAFDINVDSSGGVVTLRGTVPSQESRRIAEEIARDTDGVKEVKNQISVDHSAKPDPQMANLGTRVSDLELRTRLDDTLDKDSSLRDDDIKIDVQNGVVNLDGEVDTTEEKRAAEAQAWRLNDIKDVRNNLRVKGQEETDQPKDELAKRVEFELYSSRAFNLEPINVRSSQGVVILDGQVRSQAEKILAGKLAHDVDGVKSVKNNLSVMPEAEPSAPSTQPTE